MLWLYSPETMMKASAFLIRPASRSSPSGACPGAYSLYILSRSGSRSSAGSTSVALWPRPVHSFTMNRAALIPWPVRTEP